MKTQQFKIFIGCSKSSSKREVWSNTGLSQENKNLNLTLYLKKLEKGEQMKSKIRRDSKDQNRNK